jgi:excisionase family DNA binding protein
MEGQVFHLDANDIAAIAAEIRRAIADRAVSPWLDAQEAATYMRCPVSRVRKLTMTGELPHEHDGRRVLYHRDRLDQYIREGGATSP